MQDGGKKGKGKGKGKEKKGGYKGDNGNSKNGEARKSNGPSIFEGKEYKDAIDSLIANTEARLSDFDTRAVALLDTLQQHGKAEEAITTLGLSFKHKNRDDIKNWRAYIHTILRKVDPEAYTVHKTASSTPKGSKSSVSLADSLEPSKSSMCPAAVEFKPGGVAHEIAEEKETKAKDAEPKSTAAAADKKDKKGKLEIPEESAKSKPKDETQPSFLECCFRRTDQ